MFVEAQNVVGLSGVMSLTSGSCEDTTAFVRRIIYLEQSRNQVVLLCIVVAQFCAAKTTCCPNSN